MSNLALLGGRPVFEKPLKPYCSISKKEIEAVNNVLKSGCLSGFFGSWEEGFLGGPFIQKLKTGVRNLMLKLYFIQFSFSGFMQQWCYWHFTR